MRVFAVLLLSIALIFKLTAGQIGNSAARRGSLARTGSGNDLNEDLGQGGYTVVTPDGEEFTVPFDLDSSPVVPQSRHVIFVEDDEGHVQIGFLFPPPVIPESPSPEELRKKVRFHLWTRETPSSAYSEQLWVDDPDVLRASTFNHSHPTKFLIHGFMNSIASPMIQNPKNAYLDRGEYNVIGVDWGDLAKGPWYVTAKANTYDVGHYVGEMIRLLNQQVHTPLQNIHIVGHSLGAHVSGIAGNSMGETKVGRVTGLDPAGPLYYVTTPIDKRLDSSDANYVDVIHTCGGYPPNLGFKKPLGMADFYPNGGVNRQPGCPLPSVLSITCSHSYAHVLWTQTIIAQDPSKNKAYKCKTLDDAYAQRCAHNAENDYETDGQIGEFSDPSMRGYFWLRTYA